MVKPKVSIYEPLQNDEILDKQAALIQASSIIDILMGYALESKSVETMTWCAATWLEIADRLPFGDDPEEELEQEIGEKHMIGFTANGKDISLNESRD